MHHPWMNWPLVESRESFRELFEAEAERERSALAESRNKRVSSASCQPLPTRVTNGSSGDT